MTHNHSLFRSLCTQRWTRACSLSPEAPSFWLAFQARPALCMHVFVKVQCSSLGSTLEDKCFSVFSTDWRWQWWRTSNSAVAAFIAKRPRVAYSCSYVLLPVPISRETIWESNFSHVTWWLLWNDKRWLANQPAGCSTTPRQSPAFQKSGVVIHASGLGLFDVHEDQRDRAG